MLTSIRDCYSVEHRKWTLKIISNESIKLTHYLIEVFKTQTLRRYNVSINKSRITHCMINLRFEKKNYYGSFLRIYLSDLFLSHIVLVVMFSAVLAVLISPAYLHSVTLLLHLFIPTSLTFLSLFAKCQVILLPIATTP